MNIYPRSRNYLLLLSVAWLAGCATDKQAPLVDRSSSANEIRSVTTPHATASVEAAKPAAVDRVARKGYYIVKEGDTLYRIALEHGQGYRDLAAWNGLSDPNRITVGQELRVAPPEGDDGQPVAVAKPVVVVQAIEQRPLDGNTDAVKTLPKAGREPYSDEALARLSKPVEAIARVELRTEGKPEIRSEPKVEPKSATAAKGDEDIIWSWPASGKIGMGFVEGSSKGIDILGKKGDPVLAASDGKVVYAGSGLRGYGQLLIVKHNNMFLTAYAHNSKVLVKEGQVVSKGQKIAEMGDSEAEQVKLHFEVRRQGKPVDPTKYLPARQG